MAITYPLILPAEFQTSQLTVTARAVVGVSESPLDLTEQVYAWPAQRWELAMKLRPMKRDTAEEVLAIMLALNAREGTFYCGDTSARVPRGVATGVPLTNGSQASRSYTITTKGWTPSTNKILKKGDWIQIGTGATRKLHKVIINDVNSDGAGNATLTVWPRTRTAYAGDLTVVTSNPTGVFRMTDVTTWSVDVMRVYGVALSANETLP